MHSCTTLVAITQWPGSATTTNVGPSSTLPVPRMAPELTAARCFPCAPPLQAAATYNLDEVMAQIRASGHPPGQSRDACVMLTKWARPQSSSAPASGAPHRCTSGFSPCRRRTCTTAHCAVASDNSLSWDRHLRDARDRRVLARRGNELLGRRLVEVGEAYALHGAEAIEVAPVFLEAVRRR